MSRHAWDFDSIVTAAKVGSILRHVEEALSPDGHHFDLAATRGLLDQEDVQRWLARMDTMDLLPKRRKGP